MFAITTKVSVDVNGNSRIFVTDAPNFDGKRRRMFVDPDETRMSMQIEGHRQGLAAWIERHGENLTTHARQLGNWIAGNVDSGAIVWVLVPEDYKRVQ